MSIYIRAIYSSRKIINSIKKPIKRVKTRKDIKQLKPKGTTAKSIENLISILKTMFKYAATTVFKLIKVSLNPQIDQYLPIHTLKMTILHFNKIAKTFIKR